LIFFGISPSSWTQKTAASNLGRFTYSEAYLAGLDRLDA